MSIEIDWEKLTTGPDGLELAETIRDFVHDKFQQVSLPGFIRSVEVLSFEFGDQCPVVELKDVCDPLPDFYDDDEDDQSDENQNSFVEPERSRGLEPVVSENRSASIRERRDKHVEDIGIGSAIRPFSHINGSLLRLHSNLSIANNFASPILSGTSTPGIPGGSSNLSYFHLPLSAGLSGTHTPLAAVAGGNQYTQSRLDNRIPNRPRLRESISSIPQRVHDQEFTYADPSTRPSTAHSYGRDATPERSLDGIVDVDTHEPDPSDVQIVLHISYQGNIRMSLTAEILLDYPMPSFVGIPLKLNITGLSFDGVALLAYLKSKMHFCFLGPDDAEVLVGAENALDRDETNPRLTKDKIGGLLKEIKVESEIGQKEEGKQVLKNVGKVEKFILEQVRRIFEDEFVYPSFWTFLL